MTAYATLGSTAVHRAILLVGCGLRSSFLLIAMRPSFRRDVVVGRCSAVCVALQPCHKEAVWDPFGRLTWTNDGRQRVGSCLFCFNLL